MAKFEALEIAIEAVAAVHEVIERLPRGCGALADQSRRSIISAPLNLAEGSGRAGRDRLYHWRIASGSAQEAKACMRIAAALGVDAQTALEVIDRLCAVCWRLTNPRS